MSTSNGDGDVCRRITITARGKDEQACAEAEGEAIRRVIAGNTSGSGSNDEGGFYFTVTDDVPRGKWPAG